jgi:protein TonB
MSKSQSPKPLKAPFAESLIIAGIITLALLVGLPLSQMLSDSFDPPKGPELDPTAFEPPPDITIEPPPPVDEPREKPPELERDVPPLTISQIEVLINPNLKGIGGTSVAGIIPEAGIGDLIHEIGDLTRAPRPVRQAQPAYPPDMRTAKIEGDVWIEFVVNPDGTTRNIEILRSSNMAFENAARRAIRNWTFEPGEKDGQAVHTRVRIRMPFRIN